MKRESSEFKDTLTNEQLLKRFKNQFDLVRYAIQLAENRILSGRDTEVGTDTQNVAFQTLAEIAGNKESFIELPAVEPTSTIAKHDGKESSSWSQDVKAFKEDKKEKKSKYKAAR